MGFALFVLRGQGGPFVDSGELKEKKYYVTFYHHVLRRPSSGCVLICEVICLV